MAMMDPAQNLVASFSVSVMSPAPNCRETCAPQESEDMTERSFLLVFSLVVLSQLLFVASNHPSALLVGLVVSGRK
jgi:hypothetical protein